MSTGSDYGYLNHITMGLDNTYFGCYGTLPTYTESQTLDVDPQLSTNAKDYVTLTNGKTDGDRTDVTHFSYTNTDSTVGSEAHVYWLGEKAMSKIDTTHSFVFETDFKLGDITAFDSAYNGWMMYLSITDNNTLAANDGDINSIALNFNYSKGTYKLNAKTLNKNQWYNLKIVYYRIEDTAGYDRIFVEVLLDESIVYSAISTKASDGRYDIDSQIWGFKMKCKNTKTFSQFNI